WQWLRSSIRVRRVGCRGFSWELSCEPSAISFQPSPFRAHIIIHRACRPGRSEGSVHFWRRLRRPRQCSCLRDGRRDAHQTAAGTAALHLPTLIMSDIVFAAMYQDFHALDRWTKKNVHCIYQALIVAIATRHADAVDIKFLVDGRTVWVALPHPAWVEYKKRTGKVITDQLAVESAGHYLKTALESGEGVGREMYSLTAEDTLKHLEAVAQQPEAQPVE